MCRNRRGSPTLASDVDVRLHEFYKSLRLGSVAVASSEAVMLVALISECVKEPYRPFTNIRL